MKDSPRLSLRRQLVEAQKQALKEEEEESFRMKARNDREKERLEEIANIRRRTFEVEEEKHQEGNRTEREKAERCGP